MPSWVASSASSSWPPPASSSTASSGRPASASASRTIAASAAVGALGVVGAAQDDRVAALDRQRRAVDRHVRPRLVDDGDDPQRHPDLAQVEAAGQGLVFELLADRVVERGDDPHARRPSPRPAPALSVSRSRSASVRPAARSSARSAAFASRISARALLEQPRGRLQGGVLRLRSRRSPAPAPPASRRRSSRRRWSWSRPSDKGSWEPAPSPALRRRTKRSRWITSSAACGQQLAHLARSSSRSPAPARARSSR